MRPCAIRLLGLLCCHLLLGAVGASAGSAQSRPWTYRVAGHLIGISRNAAQRRILLAATQNTSCVPSSLRPEFDCQLDCSRATLHNDLRVAPPTKHVVHWSLDDSDGLGPGIRFGIFYRGFKIDENLPFEPYNIWLPGWVGHGWSAWEPRNAPPAMINGTAVMGWIDSDGGQQVSVYNLQSKVSTGIRQTLDGFVITNASVAYTPEHAMIMRFRRSFEGDFALGVDQRMIVAHHHRKAGIIRHNHRAGVVGDFAIPGSIRVVGSRLDSAWVATHAWCMLAVFAVIFPAGIIWARYSRDWLQKWFRVHIGIQVTGMCVMVAAFIIAVTRNRPFDKSLNHFQLGVAVFTLVLLQPCSSIPRLMMHHKTEMKSVMFAYIHWTVGRAALVFGLVNLFLGISRYRTEFTLGYWAEPLLGFWVAGLAMLCLIGETRLWMRSTIRLREENDDLSRRMAKIEENQGKLRPKLTAADSMLFNQLSQPDDVSLLSSDILNTDTISQYMEPVSSRASVQRSDEPDQSWNQTGSTVPSRLSGFSDVNYRGRS